LRSECGKRAALLPSHESATTEFGKGRARQVTGPAFAPQAAIYQSLTLESRCIRDIAYSQRKKPRRR
jgi:hypothetical protein